MNVKPKIILGITGSIAAYKIPLLARNLVKKNADVYCIFTENAKKFVTTYTMQALTGNPVFDKMFYERADAVYPHIELSKDADLLVVAPASANFLAKASLGVADDLLSTVFLAVKCKRLVCPAMNKNMYENETTQRNLKSLEEKGVEILRPSSGSLACGDEGIGRMMEPEDIAKVIYNILKINE